MIYTFESALDEAFKDAKRSFFKAAEIFPPAKELTYDFTLSSDGKLHLLQEKSYNSKQLYLACDQKSENTTRIKLNIFENFNKICQTCLCYLEIHGELNLAVNPKIAHQYHNNNYSRKIIEIDFLKTLFTNKNYTLLEKGALLVIGEAVIQYNALEHECAPGFEEEGKEYTKFSGSFRRTYENFKDDLKTYLNSIDGRNEILNLTFKEVTPEVPFLKDLNNGSEIEKAYQQVTQAVQNNSEYVLFHTGNISLYSNELGELLNEHVDNLYDIHKKVSNPYIFNLSTTNFHNTLKVLFESNGEVNFKQAVILELTRLMSNLSLEKNLHILPKFLFQYFLEKDLAKEEASTEILEKVELKNSVPTDVLENLVALFTPLKYVLHKNNYRLDTKNRKTLEEVLYIAQNV